MRVRLAGGARWVAGAALVAVAAIFLLGAAAQSSRDALWMIVHGQCVPDQMEHHDPAPCTRIELGAGDGEGNGNGGYAILKDIRGTSQYLLIATAKISGIESRELVAAGGPNFFEDAWESRSYVSDALHKTLPREDISLAINSAVSRSQDQFHIHIDCVRADVRMAVSQHVAELGSMWTEFPVPFFGHHYKAIWEPGEDLKAANPFQLAAAGLPGAAEDMGDRTLVVVPATKPGGKPGFVILEDQVNRASHNLASGEELQDHDCSVAKDPGAGN